MKGIYLYCIRNREGNENGDLNVRGIFGVSKATRFPYKDIEAIVSAVDLNKFGSKKIAKQAREDLHWIIKHAQKHEKVIESAMMLDGKVLPVIPMKFGMIFEKEQNLEDILSKEYITFKKLLEHFKNRQEWSVKVYAKESTLKEKLKLSEKKVHRHVREAKKLPRGADYFGELKVEKELDAILKEKTEELSNTFFSSLSTCALEFRNNKILTKEIAGHKEPMILNSAYLIEDSTVRHFIDKVNELQKNYSEFIFEYTGPWPAYNFMTARQEIANSKKNSDVKNSYANALT